MSEAGGGRGWISRNNWGVSLPRESSRVLHHKASLTLPFGSLLSKRKVLKMGIILPLLPCWDDKWSSLREAEISWQEKLPAPGGGSQSWSPAPQVLWNCHFCLQIPSGSSASPSPSIPMSGNSPFPLLHGCAWVKNEREGMKSKKNGSGWTQAKSFWGEEFSFHWLWNISRAWIGAWSINLMIEASWGLFPGMSWWLLRSQSCPSARKSLSKLRGTELRGSSSGFSGVLSSFMLKGQTQSGSVFLELFPWNTTPWERSLSFGILVFL